MLRTTRPAPSCIAIRISFSKGRIKNSMRVSSKVKVRRVCSPPDRAVANPKQVCALSELQPCQFLQCGYPKRGLTLASLIDAHLVGPAAHSDRTWREYIQSSDLGGPTRVVDEEIVDDEVVDKVQRLLDEDIGSGLDHSPGSSVGWTSRQGVGAVGARPGPAVRPSPAATG